LPKKIPNLEFPSSSTISLGFYATSFSTIIFASQRSIPANPAVIETGFRVILVSHHQAGISLSDSTNLIKE